MYEKSPELQHRQRQILYGTILGGASVIKPAGSRNCYVAMRDRDLNWLTYKIEELAELFAPKDRVVRQDKNTFRCYSVSYPVCNELYDLFYVDRKKVVRPEILDMLNDLAWMVWFVDAGKKTSQKVFLRTRKFGVEGTNVIVNYFNSLDCPCVAGGREGCNEVVFSNEGAARFLKTIAHRMPKFILRQYD